MNSVSPGTLYSLMNLLGTRHCILTSLWFSLCGMSSASFSYLADVSSSFQILLCGEFLPATTFAKYCCLVTKLCPTLCDPMDCNMAGFPVLHYFLEFPQTHVHWVSDAFQPSHPLSPPSPLAFNPSQHQGLFQWVGSLHQVTKILELQLQYQSFQWMFRVEFL